MKLLNTSIRIIRKNAGFIENFIRLSPDTVFISIITFHELYYGALESRNPPKKLAALNDFIRCLTILPFKPSSARHSATIRESLATKGTPIGPLDTLIAGHALKHELTLVTRNIREFSRVDGLTLENWSLLQNLPAATAERHIPWDAAIAGSR